MIATVEKERIYTVEEYFELEKTSEIRHEFVHGKLIPSNGQSKCANEIVNNFYFQFRLQLQGKHLEIYTHDVRLMLEKSAHYRYPDLVVAPSADDEDTHAVIMPVALVEVLSESTSSADRGAKLKAYLKMPTLQYYLIIEQNELGVEVYTREENDWRYSFFTAPNDEVKLPALGATISLSNIYEGVSFESETPKA